MDQKLYELLQHDPRVYLGSFCKIKSKEGGLIPFKVNKPQNHLFKQLDEYNRVIILKARQMGFCLHPDTRILTEELTWKRIDDVVVGEKIIGVDEHAKGQGNARKMKSTIIEDKWDVFEDSFTIELDNGVSITATSNHRFLGKKWESASETTWKKVKDFKVGDSIRTITEPWGDVNYEDGWVSGMIDGEGSIAKKSRSGAKVSISQVDGFVWERLVKYFNNNGYNFRVERDERKAGNSSKLGDKPVNKIVVSRMDELFRLLGKTRPSRFQQTKWWEGKMMPGKGVGTGWAKIISISYSGKQRMIDLQTSERTFIAEGIVSHNSVGVCGYLYHRTITNPGTNTVIISYKKDEAAQLLEHMRLFWETTPDEFKPKLKYNTKYEMSFPNLHSTITVLPSTATAGRGRNIHNLHVTELAFWENSEETFSGLSETVSEHGTIIVESTPNGVGNLYHQMWVNKENGYKKLKYGPEWMYSEEWLNNKRKEIGERRYAQEYDCNFITSGNIVFDVDVIDKHRENVKTDGFEVDEKWRIYKRAQPGHKYVISVDPSSGIAGGDPSVVMVFDRMTGEEVLFYRDHIQPSTLAKKLNTWGRLYNSAYCIVEENSYGLVVLEELKKLAYPNMYFRRVMGERENRMTSRLGWRTSVRTKALMIDELKKYLREDPKDGGLIIRSPEVLDEMMVFEIKDNGRMSAADGYHDDCIMSLALNVQGLKLIPTRKLEQINENEHVVL